MKRQILILLFFLLIYGCHSNRQAAKSSGMDLANKRLKTLDQIQLSILKVMCSAYYENYYYTKPPESVESAELKDLLFKKQLTTNSVAGTALILEKTSSKILLLSCYHVFDFQDTIKIYYKDQLGDPTDNLLSLSVKYDQRIFVMHRSGVRTMGRLIVFDKQNDIALLETDADKNQLSEIPFFAPFAKGNEFKFGKEVYLIGYPKGFLFITKGLLSKAPYKNRFLVSAAFNRGFSGGVVVGFDENSEVYRYFGMTNSMAYDSQIILAPEDESLLLENYKDLPYHDNIFVKELKLINYGLTFAIKSSLIRDFVEKNREKIRSLGFVLPGDL